MKGKNGHFVPQMVRDGCVGERHIFLPQREAFTPFGAMVKTCLCVLQKVGSGARSAEGETTFLCEVEI